MNFYLPTRDEAKAIVEKSDAFYCTETVVGGYNVEMYDYRLASHGDFINNNAYELRGLTFVYNPETEAWERNLLMNKFFNVNQTEGWMYDDVKGKKVVRVQDKLDGSIISFVKFPDGVIRAKSKMSFTSDQAVMAQKIYDNDPYLNKVVPIMLVEGYTPVFELVSPDNQIVLEYNETKLVLLQMRLNDSGMYLTAGRVKQLVNNLGIELAQDFDVFPSPELALDGLLALKPEKEGIEGWIVTFEDGQMAKIKTDWYLQLHGLIGPDAFRENLLVQTILDGNIDDVISNLVPGVKKDKIVELAEKVEHQFNHLVVEYKNLRGQYFNVYDSDRKKFAMKYAKTHPLFGYVMKRLNTSFRDVEKTAEDAVKEYILKQCSTLSSAKEWVEGI